MFVAGALVAELAFEPEHAEVIAADDIDVVASLVLRAEVADAAAEIRAEIILAAVIAVGGVHVHVLAGREQEAPFESDIAAVVTSCRRCRNGSRGGCC
jgi:hypothetical protein